MLKSPHADTDTSTAQAGALMPTSSPSTSRLPSTAAQPTWYRLRMTSLLLHPHGVPTGGCAPHVDAAATCVTPGVRLGSSAPPPWPLWFYPQTMAPRLGLTVSDGQNACQGKFYS